jgi:hypothetical protein
MHTAGNASREALKLNAATMNWYTLGGWSHRINGAASETATNGFALYESYNASASETGYDIMGDNGFGGGNRNWIGEVGFILTMNAQPTTAQRAASLAAVRAYYNF